MKEQEKYVTILQKAVEATENEHIHSSEELINMLVNELSPKKPQFDQ
ncbi:MAG TPA: hypothetical protein VK142_04710 [Bacillota bacterium]|nr:hypothetical protein [Bacillota bacterium]